MKIVHVITGLNTGGAEMMLYKLLSAIDSARFENHVISLTNDRVVGDKIAALGVPVQYLGMAHGRFDLPRFLRLIHAISKLNPDVVQTWMYHADLLGGLAAKLAGVKHVVWNIRHSDLPAEHTKRSTRLTARLCALLSHWLPDRIICNAQRSVAVHVQLGYKQSLFEIIGNGFDLQRFKPDVAAKAGLCRELNAGSELLLVGLVARFDVQKNHRGFVAAAQTVAKQMPNTHFILAGRNADNANAELRQWIDNTGCGDRFHLLGERHDIGQLTAGFDVAVSCSIFGEGFPNTVGEAMASGVPCVVSDAGDSATIVGDTGIVVPLNDNSALADSLLQLLRMPVAKRAAMGLRARQRMLDNYSLPVIVKRFESLYLKVCHE
jgi:glycosyltransferase involved in cell wall biosynthesis